MYGEARKLHLIEEILKVDDDNVLLQVESLLAVNKAGEEHTINFDRFAGMLTDEEVDALEKTIENGCETINPNDWK